MGSITVQEYTTKDPLQLIGYEAGVCWGADILNAEKNKKRGIGCVKSEHGRTWEFPQVYLTIDGYSARVIRELYTHIGGSPTRTQASTRYIDYEAGFDYVIPPSIAAHSEATLVYKKAMNNILGGLNTLEELGVPREDCALLLPLGMTTKVILRTNFRNLVDMSHQRMCSRAYWEFRELMNDIRNALIEYSPEWKYLVETCLQPKCEYKGFCTEEKSCGRKPRRE